MPVQDDGPAGLGGYQLPSFNRGRRSPGATHVSHRAQKDAEAQRSSALLQCLAPVGKGDWWGELRLAAGVAQALVNAPSWLQN